MTTATTGVSIQREPELLGQTVVVIGGSAGIGLETARRARAEGASIILTGRNPDRLKQSALELDAQRMHSPRPTAGRPPLLALEPPMGRTSPLLRVAALPPWPYSSPAVGDNCTPR